MTISISGSKEFHPRRLAEICHGLVEMSQNHIDTPGDKAGPRCPIIGRKSLIFAQPHASRGEQFFMAAKCGIGQKILNLSFGPHDSFRP